VYRGRGENTLQGQPCPVWIVASWFGSYTCDFTYFAKWLTLGERDGSVASGMESPRVMAENFTVSLLPPGSSCCWCCPGNQQTHGSGGTADVGCRFAGTGGIRLEIATRSMDIIPNRLL